MTTKHTSGPWGWDGMPPKHHREHNWEDSAPWLVNDDEVAVLTGEIACKNPFNAYLIAAAPCLYAALKDAAAALGGMQSDNVPQTVRDALAKAEGRS